MTKLFSVIKCHFVKTNFLWERVDFDKKLLLGSSRVQDRVSGPKPETLQNILLLEFTWVQVLTPYESEHSSESHTPELSD